MSAMPKDAAELFDVMVPEALSKFPEKAKEINAIYCFKVEGDGGGTWTINLASDPPTCEKGDSGNAQCTVELTHDDFKSMLADPQLGMQLYFSGRLKVSGDPMLAMKLQQVFDMAKQ